MAHSFITNRDRLLSDIITGILPKSDAVDILVGYFYFSGYAHLADKLADKYLRILVGLDIDTRISNRVREVEELVEWQRIRSNSSVRFMTVHWRYARQKTRAMQKCTSLPITTVTTRMENSPVM